jgi:uncharacterized membrane protein YedE/YeeE
MSLAVLPISEIGAALAGGALIGAAASLLLTLNGRIAGVSGIVGGLFSRDRDEVRWRVLFVAGLLAGGALFGLVKPEALAVDVHPSTATTVVAGLLVGFGTTMASGCTSGHGVCGISRLSNLSIIATATFMATGMLTVFLVHHVVEGTR